MPREKGSPTHTAETHFPPNMDDKIGGEAKNGMYINEKTNVLSVNYADSHSFNKPS